MKQASIRVGVIADQTGPLSFMGIANANVAKMVVDDINANSGLLGRQIDLFSKIVLRSTASPRPRLPSSCSMTMST